MMSDLEIISIVNPAPDMNGSPVYWASVHDVWVWDKIISMGPCLH